PGTPPDAIILGALLVHGVRTGPNLFSEQSQIVYTFMFGLVIATILMLPIGLVLGRYAFRTVIAVPKYVLAPMIALMTILGTYAIQNSIEDVAIMLTLGVAAWLLGRAGFGPAPIVLGVVRSEERRVGEEGSAGWWT